MDTRTQTWKHECRLGNTDADLETLMQTGKHGSRLGKHGTKMELKKERLLLLRFPPFLFVNNYDVK
jgi:hypothetical protein